MIPAAQDPGELFDLVDSEGRPLGRTKARSLVHRDGDWHRAIHVWVVHTSAPEARVILQRRSLEKDTWPGLVDVSVGGHLGAGETAEMALREAHEEIGLALSPSEIHLLGRVAQSRSLPGPVLDREILDVYVARSVAPLEAFTPHPAEVSELLSVTVDDALALWRGERSEASAQSLAKGELRDVVLTAGELCGPDGGFRAKALAAVKQWAREGSVTPWAFPSEG